jgi:hypothetical protein
LWVVIGHLYHVALGASPPEVAALALAPASGSAARGFASLNEPGVGRSPNPAVTVQVRLSGLVPGSVHAVQILPGVCGAPAPTTGLIFSHIFIPPAFTLSNVTAGPGGTATSTTVLTEPPNPNGAGLLRIPSADGTSNETHGVTFLAGTPLPQIPDWYFSTPTTGTTYDGSAYFNSGPLYETDAPGLNHSLTLTFTKAGTFGYVDVGDFILGMRGSVIVTPPDTSPARGGGQARAAARRDR